MANDYMAKLAADLEGMSMMRSPKPMTVVYRDMVVILTLIMIYQKLLI